MSSRAFVCLILVLLTTVAASAAAQPVGLWASIDAAKSFVGRADRPVVTVTLGNDSARDLYVVAWQTPLRGVQGNLFDVRRNGEPVAYLGPLVKRAAPRAGDYLRIPAGDARSVRVDLAAAYDFSRGGEYTIQYRTALQDALRDDAPAAIDVTEVASNVAIVAVERDEGAARFLSEAARHIHDNASTGFVGCSSSRQGSLKTARANATTIAGKAVDWLAAHEGDSAYTTWFGVFTSSRLSSVQSHFTKIRSAMANAAVTFDCTCSDSAYAYVYSYDPYTIHLCRAFWSAPALGTDSKAGTLVHEMSHFRVVAGTDDWAYGQNACKNLAKSSPLKAIDNADTHEYYAESRP
ncbi:MAG TPA: M35 family metallo-endopeptidase [Thermoanaerobaculia bacterium]|jgi:peptidyl-Lys metalloendopeptidase|nr:M35 family metallo-endopeptidase [Thermoanaerobaculia bacterium]